MSKTIIINARIILPDRVIENGCIEFVDSKITALYEGCFESGNASRIINAQGNWASAGFIDIHTHGAGGHDFMDGTVEAYLGAARMHASHGTTALVPTTLTSTDEDLLNTFRVYKEAKEKNTEGAEFLGIHLEGPYFAYSQRGAQDPKYLRNPDPKEYNRFLAASDDIVRWSLAPELEGALEFGRRLKSMGILPSIGHTDAIYEEAIQAYAAGFTHCTHLYSCMSTVTRRNAFRYAGVLEAAYMLDDMTVEIIADGIHLPKSLLQYVYKFKGADRIALVTDSMRGAGMPEGESILGALNGGQRVLIEDGVAKLPDRSAFAGSVATADRLIRTMVNIAEVPLIDAVKMMTLTPARIMKIDKHKGSLTVGKDADIVIFDDEINIKTTIVGGKCLIHE